ncbi:hypothetical protein JP75_06530 [Devosia riboflavina]|uniref:Uncharacterized protein n=1 Tax=Devosia riboflavina TaxID=46914 RepID=A0A087M4C2_9HYPH|nr:hypothetical protein [Devosia riboflavina]KFL31725.1 hypothetical protein JP75_06530 [Devosia riboflavina]
MTITNSDRAAWAEAAIDAFRAVCPTDAEDAPGDLVTDILHYVRRECGVADLQAWLAARLAMHDMEVSEDPEDDDEEEVSIWQLAEDKDYGEQAGWFILTSPDGEIEQDGGPWQTEAEAEQYAIRKGWRVVPLDAGA